MSKPHLDQWAESLQSLLSTYAKMAQLGSALVAQSHRHKYAALQLYLDFSHQQLGHFWGWFYPHKHQRIDTSSSSSQGLTLAIALDVSALGPLRQALANHGQRLLIVEPVGNISRSSAQADNPTPELQGSTCLQCNINSYEDCALLLQKIEHEIGPIKTLITQSGSYQEQPADIKAESVLDGELDCIYNLARQVIPGMMERGCGSIIMIADDRTEISPSSPHNAGVTGFIRMLAKELLPYGISANCISVAELKSLLTTDSRLPAKEIPPHHSPLDELTAFLANVDDAGISGEDIPATL